MVDRYENVTCGECGCRFQRIDFGSALHSHMHDGRAIDWLPEEDQFDQTPRFRMVSHNGNPDIWNMWCMLGPHSFGHIILQGSIEDMAHFINDMAVDKLWRTY